MTTMVCGIAPLRAPIPFTNSKSTLKPSLFSRAIISSMISIPMHLLEPTTPAGKVTLRGVPLLKSIPSEEEEEGRGRDGEEEGEEEERGRIKRDCRWSQVNHLRTLSLHRILL